MVTMYNSSNIFKITPDIFSEQLKSKIKQYKHEFDIQSRGFTKWYADGITKDIN